MEKLHYLLESARGPAASWPTTSWPRVETATSFVDRPLYALLHESIYCQGEASRWAAQRVARRAAGVRSRRAAAAADRRDGAARGCSRPTARSRRCAEAAELLAAYDGWPALYDLDGSRRTTVPVAAAVYHDDMYVEHAFSLETAERVGNLRWWVTSELGHDGLRSDARVLDRLLDLAAGDA